MTCSPATACASSTASSSPSRSSARTPRSSSSAASSRARSIIGRLYTLHILLVPALILLMIVMHLFMVVVHKHTQYPGPGRNDGNVVGYPLGPVYAAKAGGFFFIVFGVIALMAAFFTINPIWNYGPYDPSPVSAGTQPDWYIGFVDGALRLMPGTSVTGRSSRSGSATCSRSTCCCRPSSRRASSSRSCSPTRGSNAGSPRTTASTTSWTVPATLRPAPRSAWPASSGTASCGPRPARTSSPRTSTWP